MCYHKHVLKNFVDKPSPAIERGRKIHKAFEERVRFGARLPTNLVTGSRIDDLSSWESAAAAFDDRPTVMTEFKCGLNKDLLHTKFFDSDVWIRLVLDVFDTGVKNPLVVDYKTGRYSAHHESDAEFYGAAVCLSYNFARLPVQYWYIDNPVNSFEEVVTKEEARPLMERWRELFQAAEMAMDQHRVPAVEGKQCNWCQVADCVNYRG